MLALSGAPERVSRLPRTDASAEWFRQTMTSTGDIPRKRRKRRKRDETPGYYQRPLNSTL
jgi:hypothetical protein